MNRSKTRLFYQIVGFCLAVTVLSFTSGASAGGDYLGRENENDPDMVICILLSGKALSGFEFTLRFSQNVSLVPPHQAPFYQYSVQDLNVMVKAELKTPILPPIPLPPECFALRANNASASLSLRDAASFFNASEKSKTLSEVKPGSKPLGSSSFNGFRLVQLLVFTKTEATRYVIRQQNQQMPIEVTKESRVNGQYSEYFRFYTEDNTESIPLEHMPVVPWLLSYFNQHQRNPAPEFLTTLLRFLWFSGGIPESATLLLVDAFGAKSTAVRRAVCDPGTLGALLETKRPFYKDALTSERVSRVLAFKSLLSQLNQKSANQLLQLSDHQLFMMKAKELGAPESAGSPAPAPVLAVLTNLLNLDTREVRYRAEQNFGPRDEDFTFIESSSANNQPLPSQSFEGFISPRRGRLQKTDLPDGDSLLGEGGSGRVWKVSDQSNGVYALKVFQPWARGSSTMHRLNKLQELDSPLMVKTYDIWMQNGDYYHLMEFCPDGDLDQFTRQFRLRKFLPSIITQMSLAVAYLHSNEFVHRDIKPANYMLCKNGNRHNPDSVTVKLADFDMIKMARPGEMMETLAGTDAFMGSETSQSFFWRKLYDGYQMDRELLANSIIAVLGNGYPLFFEKTVTLPPDQIFSEKQRLYEELAKGQHQNKTLNIKSNLMMELSEKRELRVVDDNLLLFIAELLTENSSVDPKQNHQYLAQLMLKNPYFRSEHHKIRQLLPELGQWFPQQLTIRCAAGLHPQFVPGDGNCLPAAIAAAYRYETGKAMGQIELRRQLNHFLARIFRHLKTLTSGLQQQLFAELAAITGYGQETLQQMIDDSIIITIGTWLPDGLLALIPPMLGVNIDQVNTLLGQTIHHSFTNLQNNAPNLFANLTEVGIFLQPPLAPPHTITIVHNGAHNDSGQGHYVWAIQTDTPQDAEAVQPVVAKTTPSAVPLPGMKEGDMQPIVRAGRLLFKTEAPP